MPLLRKSHPTFLSPAFCKQTQQIETQAVVFSAFYGKTIRKALPYSCPCSASPIPRSSLLRSASRRSKPERGLWFSPLSNKKSPLRGFYVNLIFRKLAGELAPMRFRRLPGVTGPCPSTTLDKSFIYFL